MPNTLFLRLEAPLQSWGERGRWSVRDTADAPTKSGVIGLVACAAGYAADEPIRRLSAGTRMGVRIDKPGVRLTDYHTIGGGYDQPMLLTAQKKPKKSGGGPHTELSYRDYLCDASFLVALQSDDDGLIAEMQAAVQNPTWVIFLGRKSCPPAQPVYAGTGAYDTLTAALRHHQWPIPPEKYGRPAEPIASLRAVIECPPDHPDAGRRRDHLHSRRYRAYHPRYARTTMIDAPQEETR